MIVHYVQSFQTYADFRTNTSFIKKIKLISHSLFYKYITIENSSWHT